MKNLKLNIISWIIAIIIVFFGLNLIAVWLWSIIAVGIFALPAISFWQMFGLRILLHIILPTVIIKK